MMQNISEPESPVDTTNNIINKSNTQSEGGIVFGDEESKNTNTLTELQDVPLTLQHGENNDEIQNNMDEELLASTSSKHQTKFHIQSWKTILKTGSTVIKVLLLLCMYLVLAFVWSLFPEQPIETLAIVNENEPTFLDLGEYQHSYASTLTVQVKYQTPLPFEQGQTHQISFFVDTQYLSDNSSIYAWLPCTPLENSTLSDNSTSEVEQENILILSHPQQSNNSKLTTEELSMAEKTILVSLPCTFPLNSDMKLRLRMESTIQMPLLIKPVLHHDLIYRYRVLIAAFILAGVYVLIIFELVHRTTAGLLGAFVAMCVQSIIHERPALETVISYIDFDTITLLFGMMIMVGIFAETGFFEFCALLSYKLSRGKLWVLMILLSGFTGVVSAFLDNVTTMLLVAPVTIKLCDVLQISPVPMILSEILMSNLGGTATPIGDPPLVIAVNHDHVKRKGVGFLEMTINLAPGVLFSSIFGFAFLLLFYRKTFFGNATQQQQKEGQKEIEMHETTSHAGEEHSQPQIQEEQEQEQANLTPVQKMEKNYRIKNMKLLLICLTVLGCVMILFFAASFIEAYLHIHLTLAWIACIGAIAMIIFSDVHDMDKVMHKVEWSTLLFFASLFVLMKTLEQLGLIDFIGTQTANLIKAVPGEKLKLFCAVNILLWVSALVSAFIDNIPYTTAMVPIVVSLSEEPTNLPLWPILWALLFGTCLGGNGTLIGASANVVSAGICESHGFPISFARFFKTGFPFMLITVFVVNIYLLVVYVLLGVAV